MDIYITQQGIENPVVRVYKEAYYALYDTLLYSHSNISKLESGEIIESENGFVKVWKDTIN